METGAFTIREGPIAYLMPASPRTRPSLISNITLNTSILFYLPIYCSLTALTLETDVYSQMGKGSQSTI